MKHLILLMLGVLTFLSHGGMVLGQSLAMDDERTSALIQRLAVTPPIIIYTRKAPCQILRTRDREDWERQSLRQVSVLFAAWEDGTVIWNDDRLLACGGWRAGLLSKSELCELQNRLIDCHRQHELSSDSHLLIVPDAAFRILVVRPSEEGFLLATCHIEPEALSEEIVGDPRSGLVYLCSSDCADRETYLQREPEEVRSFHDLWIELTAVLDEAIPKDERLLLSGHVGYDYRTQGVYLVEFAPNP